MAAPEYVPSSLEEQPRRGLDLPPADRWGPSDDKRLGPRPADLGPAQPRGPELGHPGPDQGYALKLARRLEDRVKVQSGERAEDALTGAVLVGLKRASLFGRAPVIHDIELGLAAWGFLDDNPPAELVTTRRQMFQGLTHTHHYREQRHVVDAVPEASLRKTPQQVREEVRTNWRDLLHLT